MRLVARTGILLLLTAPSIAVAQVESAQRAQAWIARSALFRTKYYEVRTDMPPDDAMAHALHMDLTCEAYVSMFRGLNVRRPSRLRLFMFQSQDDYMAVLRHSLNVDGTGSQGMCITRKDSVTLAGFRGRAGDERFRQLLQHEGFHQFASILFPGLPTWINEGLAEVFERGVPVDGTLVIGEVRRRDRAALDARLESQQFMPFARFFALRNWGQAVRGGAAGTNYLQAWSMSHFFLFAENGALRPGFFKFLMLLNNGAKPEAAWLTAFGVPNFANMEAKWGAYVRDLRAEDYRETIRHLEFLAAGLLRLREDDVVPLTIDQLREELQKAKFEHVSVLFGESKTIRTSAEVFRLPGSTHGAAYELVDVRGRKIDPKRPPRSRVPLRLATTGLQAQNFAVQWVRKSGDYVPRLGVR